MEHNDIRHRLSEYIDGSVTGEEKAAIDAHLKTCQQCGDALQELRKTIEHIKTVEEIDPPAWMTQKIMATVRAETEGKKSIFQKLFSLLSIKLPIQAIAILFLAVTGFYIYQNLQPRERRSEAPTREFAARNEEPPTGTVQDKLAKADGPAVRSKQVPQTPAYKALDMKLEYEKPSTPTFQDQAAAPAPAPAKPAEQPALAKVDDAKENRSEAPQADIPTMLQGPIAQSASKALQAEGKQEPAALGRNKKEAASANAGADSTFTITVAVKDIETAARETEATIKQLGGRITKSEQLEIKRIYTATISVHRFNDLFIKLKTLGAVQDRTETLESGEGQMVFRIEIVKTSVPQ